MKEDKQKEMLHNTRQWTQDDILFYMEMLGKLGIGVGKHSHGSEKHELDKRAKPEKPNMPGNVARDVRKHAGR